MKRVGCPTVRWALLSLGIAFASFAAAEELEVVSGPVLTPSIEVPLGAVLELSTNVPSRVVVTASDGIESWEKAFPYATDHSLPLLGFKPERNYEIRVALHDVAGNSLDLPDPLVFATDPLPDDFPPIEILESKPQKMEPGFTLFGVRGELGRDYYVSVDSRGDVVWYVANISTGDARQMADGNLFFLSREAIIENDMLWRTERYWPMVPESETPPEGTPVIVDGDRFHHEAFPTRHGTVLTLIREMRIVEDYPTSDTDPDAPTATAEVTDDPVIEFDQATGEILNRWSLLDMLDPTRIGYGSVGRRNDWGHANAVIHDPRDDSVMVSLRHQDAVVKFSRSTGELIWILGPHENWGAEFQPFLLTPVGGPFEWQYHQHSPMITPRDTLLLFDNGNQKASPFHGEPTENADSFSRAVEYDINEQTMEVSQLWEYGTHTAERLFAVRVSDADWLPSTGNVLIDFGGLIYVDGVETNGDAVRIVEVTHDANPEKVFELSIVNTEPDGGWLAYRSERIGDLYAADGDRDGFTDISDRCVASATEPTVVIGRCDSGVTNRLGLDGCTFSDSIAEIRAEAPNHGQFIKALSQMLKTMESQGTIGHLEAVRVRRCAAWSHGGSARKSGAQGRSRTHDRRP